MKKITVVLLLFLSYPLFSQMVEEIEFSNAPVSDILLALGSYSGTTILPDETVTGTSSYYFSRMELRTALALFLSANNLYSWEEEGIIYVSRILCSHNEELGRMTLHAEDVDIEALLKRIMKESSKTILYDTLPRINYTLHLQEVDLNDLLSVLLLRLEDYELIEEGASFYLHRIPEVQVSSEQEEFSSRDINREGDLYSIDMNQGRFRDILRTLFGLAEREYAFLGRNDSLLNDLHFEDKSFDEILRLVLQQGDSDYMVSGDLTYIFDIQRTDVLRNYILTEVIPLEYITVNRFQSLIPSSITASSNIRYDTERNAIILSGSPEILTPVKDFAALVDQPDEDKDLCKFTLKYLSFSEFSSLLPQSLSGLGCLGFNNDRSFMGLLSPYEEDQIEEYLDLLDIPTQVYPVYLRYISAENLLEKLPPSVSSEQISTSTASSLVFFSGSEEEFQQFTKDLLLVDVPLPQIRYELMVIQYQDTENVDWGFSINNSVASTGGVNTFLGTLGNLLNLNFDIVSLLGYQFSLKLNTSIGNSSANILANTTINGLSGEDISFQNTNTYRYTESDIDPDTQQPISSGVTREIQSGLILKINGWVSGDGMITMEIDSTVSKQGASSDTAAIPTTSEKVVSTQIRTNSGTPIIIGGLRQKEDSISIQKIPFLGDIPLLGWLFSSRDITKEETEMVIYIVPYLEYPEVESLKERISCLSEIIFPEEAE